MELKEIVGAGVLVAGVTAGMAMGQNQVDVSGSKQPSAPVEGTTVAESGGASGGSSAPGGGLAPSGTRAGFAEAGPVRLNRLDGNEYATGLLLHNPHCTAETVTLSAQLFDRRGDPVEVTLAVDDLPDPPNVDQPATKAADPPPGSWEIPAGAYDRRVVRIAPAPGAAVGKTGIVAAMRRALSSSATPYGGWTGHLPARGVLILTRHTLPSKPAPKPAQASDTSAEDQCRTKALDPRTARRELILQPPLPSTVDTGVLFAALALSLAATGIAAGVILYRSRTKVSEVVLGSQMDTVGFDFGKSWGTNVAVFGSIITALTRTAILSPDQYSSNATSYAILSGLFTVLLVPLGGMLHGLIRPPAQDPPGTQTRTYVAVYLQSTALVLWGAFGQLLVIGMLFRELELARVLAREPSVILILLSKAAIVMLLVYAVKTTLETVKEGTKPKTPSQTRTRATTETTTETPRPAPRRLAMI